MSRSTTAAGVSVSLASMVLVVTATAAVSAEMTGTTLVAVNRVSEVGLAGPRTET